MKINCRVRKIPPLVSILSQITPVWYFTVIYVWFFLVTPFLQIFLPKPVCIPFLSHTYYMPAHISLLDLIILMLFGEDYKYGAPHYMIFSSLYSFIPHRPKYPPQRPVVNNTLNLCSLNVRDQVSHPYKTARKIILLTVSRICRFLGGSGYQVGKIWFFEKGPAPKIGCDRFVANCFSFSLH
jgi:hypothetical protein